MRALVEAEQRLGWRERFNAQIVAVFSNRADAKGLVFATQSGIATQTVDHKAFAQASDPRAAFDEALSQAVQAFSPKLVLLAGFMRILTPHFVGQFEGRMLNIHPSLLPAFPGLHTHERALAAGCKFAGATVHGVTSKLDHGPIWEQAAVPVLPNDTADTLAQRVLSQEHIIYPRAVERWLSQQPR